MPLLFEDLACRDAVELVTDYLEGALSWRQRRSFERHIRRCPNCRAYFAQIRTMVSTRPMVETDALSPEARDELVDLFRRFRDDPDS